MGLAGRGVAELRPFGPSESAPADSEPRASAPLSGSHLGPHGEALHALRNATRPSVEWQSVLCLGIAFTHVNTSKKKYECGLAMKKTKNC